MHFHSVLRLVKYFMQQCSGCLAIYSWILRFLEQLKFIMNIFSLVMTLREHSGWVVKVHLDQSGAEKLISAG